jgi:phage gpG-like protein
MIEFTYAVNSEPVENALATFEESLAEQSPALMRIADDFREMIAQQFASEGQAEGTPWPPRKFSSARSTRRGVQAGRGPASPLLIRTGALRDSLTTPGAAGPVEELEGYSITLGSRLPYASYHQTGTRRMPARPIIVLSGTRAERWTEIVRRSLEEKTLLLGSKELGS